MIKKNLFAALVAVFMSALCTTVNAQMLSEVEGMPPYKLGATVGLNIPSFSGSPYNSSIGMQAGLNLMVDGSEYVAPNTFGRVEVKYSIKGATYEGSLTSAESKTITTLKDNYTTHYLEIPVHAGYAWYVNEDWSVMAEAGPYFAFGLFGNRKTDTTVVYNSSTVNHNSRSDGFFSDLGSNRFDFGMGLQFSAMYLKDYQLHVAYDFGFINMHSSFQQNRNLSFGFTYFFE